MLQRFDLLITVFGVVVTIAGISMKAGRTLQKLDYVTERITVLETKIAEIEENLHNQKVRKTWSKASVQIRKQRLK